jgi:mannose-6-phosphate isomerase
MNLYPLTFQTQFKEKIWGGNKIHSMLGKDFAPLENCGETWEISGVPGNVSVVKNGPLAGQDLQNLLNLQKESLVGNRVYEKYGRQFPLLIKFIDANADLSVQVHPDDALAKKRHNSFGKSEMWYILQADPDGKLIAGFNQPVSKQTYLDYFNQGKLMELLNVEKVAAGEVFSVPAGRFYTIA